MHFRHPLTFVKKRWKLRIQHSLGHTSVLYPSMRSFPLGPWRISASAGGAFENGFFLDSSKRSKDLFWRLETSSVSAASQFASCWSALSIASGLATGAVVSAQGSS